MNNEESVRKFLSFLFYQRGFLFTFLTVIFVPTFVIQQLFFIFTIFGANLGAVLFILVGLQNKK